MSSVSLDIEDYCSGKQWLTDEQTNSIIQMWPNSRTKYSKLKATVVSDRNRHQNQSDASTEHRIQNTAHRHSVMLCCSALPLFSPSLLSAALPSLLEVGIAEPYIAMHWHQWHQWHQWRQASKLLFGTNVSFACTLVYVALHCWVLVVLVMCPAGLITTSIMRPSKNGH